MPFLTSHRQIFTEMGTRSARERSGECFVKKAKQNKTKTPYAEQGTTDPDWFPPCPGSLCLAPPPSAWEGITFLQGTLEPLGLFSVSLDEPLELCLDHFSRVLIELEDLCLRAPWAGPIRKCSTKHT